MQNINEIHGLRKAVEVQYQTKNIFYRSLGRTGLTLRSSSFLALNTDTYLNLLYMLRINTANTLMKAWCGGMTPEL